jgi:hypothetical protein
MRVLIISLCLTLLAPGSSLFASQYSDTVVADLPIAYWKLDQTTGDTAIDAIAGNNATLVNSPTRSNPAGMPYDDGYSLLLDGANQYIELPNTGLLDLQAFSIEVWARNLSDGSGGCALYANLPSGAFWSGSGIIMRMPYPGCTEADIEFGNGVGEPESLYWSSDWEMGLGDWHHVVFTFIYQQTPTVINEAQVYVDGVLIATEMTYLEVGYDNQADGPPVDLVRVGMDLRYFDEQYSNYFHGYLDELAFYDYRLTPEQVERHYYAGMQPPPRIVSIEPLVVNSGLADALLVSFESDVSLDSFTAGDVRIYGPDGEVVATGVTSNDASTSQFLVAIPPQITPGEYYVMVGPDILGKNDLAMDQDQDGILGEIEGDDYSTSLSLGNVDPTRVLSTTPVGLGNTPVSTIGIQFELDVNASSFTVDDILLTGPNGAVAPASIDTTDNLSFTLTFNPALSDDGTYNLSIGPNIATLFGGGMDQDQDGVLGETPDDVYTASFELDLTPPSSPSGLNFLAAPQINITTLSPVTLQGERTGEEVSIWLNGVETIAMGSGVWSLSLDLTEGTTEFTLQAEDQAGNRSAPVSLRFAYDTIAPVITGYTPPNGTITNQPATTISLSYTETGTGIDQANSLLSVTRDGATVSGSWIQEINALRFEADQPLQDGLYQITQQLQDLAGHTSNTSSHGSSLDTVAPAAPLVNDLPTVTGSAQIPVSGTKEAGSEILLNGQILVSVNDLTDWSATAPLVNGLNTLSFTARDRAGNLSAATTTEVTFDDSAPGPVTLAVTDVGSGTALQLDWSSYDEAANGSDIAHYAVYIASAAYTSVSALTPVTTLASGIKQYLAQGLVRNQTYYLAVVAVDAQGNRLDSVAPVSATPLDNQAPAEITALRIVPTGTSLQISWQAPQGQSDDLAGYRLYFNNDAGTAFDTATTSAERSGLTPASGYPVRITTVDESGNESTGVSVTAATLLNNPSGLAAEGQESRITPSAYNNC